MISYRLLSASIRETLYLNGHTRVSRAMEPKMDLLTEPAWNQLQQYFDSNGSKINIYDMFRQDPKRFEKFR